MQIEEFDVVVLGGGMIGLTAACLLTQNDFSVALLDPKAPNLTWDETQFDLRCSAISKHSKKVFETLRIWEKIEPRSTPYQEMVVWDAAGFGEIKFSASDVAETDLGHIVENRVIQKALWEKLSKSPKFTSLIPDNPISIQHESSFIHIMTENKKTLSTKLCIGADGASSWLREKSNVKTSGWDYHQAALITNVETTLPHQSTAWQRFMPEGPLAFLPLSSMHSSSIVWTASKERIKALLELPDREFCDALTHAFDYRLGKVLKCGERRSFKLSMQHAKDYIKERIALVGDAAHVIHPLAGLGANLGIGDAEKLVEVLIHAHQSEIDIGNHLILRKYERARKSKVLATIGMMEFLKQTFGAKSSIISMMRSIGVSAIQKSPFLKKKVILEALNI